MNWIGNACFFLNKIRRIYWKIYFFTILDDNSQRTTWRIWKFCFLRWLCWSASVNNNRALVRKLTKKVLARVFKAKVFFFVYGINKWIENIMESDTIEISYGFFVVLNRENIARWKIKSSLISFVLVESWRDFKV